MSWGADVLWPLFIVSNITAHTAINYHFIPVVILLNSSPFLKVLNDQYTHLWLALCVGKIN